MNELDLDALEQEFVVEPGYSPMAPPRLVKALIAELRACRQERDGAVLCCDELMAQFKVERARAERAEAERDAAKLHLDVDSGLFEGSVQIQRELRERAERAEADAEERRLKLVDALEAWERAEARIAAALEEHEPRSTYGPGPADSLHPGDKMCRRCKAVWPCATARALTGNSE